MILTVANAKGGTGKSAIAYLLALYIAEKYGKDNLLCIDSDESQLSFRGSLTKQDGSLGNPRSGISDTQLVGCWELPQNMGQIQHENKYVIIDTAPSLTDYTKQAIRISDLVVAPTILTSKIVQQTLEFATMVKGIDKKYIIVPNLCSHTPSYTEKFALEKLQKAENDGFNVLLHQTYAYENLKKNIDNSDPNWGKGLTVSQRENITQMLEAILSELER